MSRNCPFLNILTSGLRETLRTRRTSSVPRPKSSHGPESFVFEYFEPKIIVRDFFFTSVRDTPVLRAALVVVRRIPCAPVLAKPSILQESPITGKLCPCVPGVPGVPCVPGVPRPYLVRNLHMGRNRSFLNILTSGLRETLPLHPPKGFQR